MIILLGTLRSRLSPPTLKPKAWPISIVLVHINGNIGQWLGAEAEAFGGGAEAGVAEDGGQTGGEGGLAVGFLDG